MLEVIRIKPNDKPGARGMTGDTFIIQVCNSIEEAPTYFAPEYFEANLIKAVIVRNGTVGGNDSIDLVFTDYTGQQHVVLVKASSLKMLADLTITNRH